MKKLYTLILLISSICFSDAANIIPAPQSVQMTEKVFNKDYLGNVLYVQDYSLPAEAYELQINQNLIIIKHSDDAGRFYAHQTLTQLADDEVMYCGVIKDAPRFEWRGLMLDESRHFFGKEEVKELIDLMSRYKLNRLHWHLSDNQGWRVEIKAYPELCTVGGLGCHSDKTAPARYYTQEEIREVVKYAAERHVEIIPEIDMPGHAKAFGRAFPDLYAGKSTVNPANPKLYEVLETIMTELAELFPGRYIHIGGDEVSTEGWRQRSDIPPFMRKKKIKSYDDIQKYFEKRFSGIVNKTGKIIVAWDEVLNGDMDKEKTVIHWWRGTHPETLEKSLTEGYKTVICTWRAFYLDYAQDSRCTKGHLVSKGVFNPLKKLYDYKFPEHTSLIGVQANLWTEYVCTPERLDYMVFPRAIATAEKAWSSEEHINYDDFLRRLEKEYLYLDKRGVYYYDFRNFSAHPEPLR